MRGAAQALEARVDATTRMVARNFMLIVDCCLFLFFLRIEWFGRLSDDSGVLSKA
jgi:hypothetical protein